MSRFRQALLRWIDQRPRVNPADVGRQERRGAAILETASWLAANGWGDVSVGVLQVYALRLLELRDAYERGEVRAS